MYAPPRDDIRHDHAARAWSGNFFSDEGHGKTPGRPRDPYVQSRATPTTPRSTHARRADTPAAPAPVPVSAPRYAYFDNAASTTVTPEVMRAMIPFFTEIFANPEANHRAGKDARDQLEGHRESIARALHVTSSEIYFTSGASESINAFIRGVAHSNCHRHRRKLVTSTIEHKAVSATCLDMEKEGYEVVQVPVSAAGLVDLDALFEAVDDNTLLVCVIMANNELGVIQPMAEIAAIAHSVGALLFSDTTQIAGKLHVFPRDLGIDALSISGHKIHGPKGVGALYMSSSIECAPIITGGHQERGQRAGTSNTPGVAGLATAIAANLSATGQHKQREVREKRDWIEEQLTQANPYTRVHSRGVPRLNNVSSVSIFTARGEPLDKADIMNYMNNRGVIVSTGSACNAGSDTSDVLNALRLSADAQRCTIRISLSALTTWDECELLVTVITEMMRDHK
jgi:cysteine desulfurase